ncbi:MAG: hypothetical protein IPI19_16215 [Ignavibacteriales bacterium]|nr:hypothetical protein [Ignavibacteriales bacterium]
MLQNTTKELLTFNKGPYVCDNPGRLDEQQTHEADLLKRGGVCRNIYELHELVKHEWLMDYKGTGTSWAGSKGYRLSSH